MARQQTGSVSGFIIIACVLVLAALGVLYGMNRRPASSGQRLSDVSQQPAAQPHSDEKAVAERSEEAPERTEGRRDARQQETRPAAAPEAAHREAAPAVGAAPEVRQRASQGNAQGDLPTTGPADSLGGVMALGATSAVAVAYVRSRKLL